MKDTVSLYLCVQRDEEDEMSPYTSMANPDSRRSIGQQLAVRHAGMIEGTVDDPGRDM